MIAQDTLLRARLGDREAFRAVVEALAKTAFNIAYRMVYNATDAEDLTQEIFLRLHRNLGQYDPAYPFLPWFRTLAVHVCINWRKRQPRSAPLDDARMPAPDVPVHDPSSVLQREIENLPTEYKMVLTLLYYEGLSVAEIAAAMEAPPGTVKTWLFRAREQLKEKLKPHVGALM
ncbi:MAG: RNA polymerase sigma factor [Planctomycetes bacterium]|nr:RNA polymerase sigma factor [Planctomycetota bacterium]